MLTAWLKQMFRLMQTLNLLLPLIQMLRWRFWMNGKETSNTSNAATRRTRILRLRLGSCALSLKQQNQNSTSSASITRELSLMGASVLLNWKRGKFNYRLATTFDMDTR
ncbi:hypothetical protein BX73_09085 [Escherichia coli O111:NM str. 2010C-4735]|nr:hypothetical protein BX93_04680 [Escherichia coli O111:NM str. 2011C-3170]EYY61866.1 hypothetical protein BX77_22345 [Escherichia coli O111:NM str. 2010C-4818]EYY72046.1 hypothetical protein BX73_09085 [Escherichia coli O111:NM str. 2010C-4735]EZA82974.1 hypothetical protein BY46_18630 [Escherichia coli O111:H8 str. F6627]